MIGEYKDIHKSKMVKIVPKVVKIVSLQNKK